MVALGLLFVGFVLIMNGLFILGKIPAKAIIPINFFTGGLQLATVARIVLFTPGAEMADFWLASAVCLFAFTYLYVGITHSFNLDPKGVGWYCLLVSIFALPNGYLALPDVGLAILWWMWATLWFMFFLLLARKLEIGKPTGVWTVVNGITTAVCAYVMLIGRWPWA